MQDTAVVLYQDKAHLSLQYQLIIHHWVNLVFNKDEQKHDRDQRSHHFSIRPDNELDMILNSLIVTVENAACKHF